MKLKKTTLALIVTATLATSVVATSSYAGTRQKPPVASAEMAPWYQPVLNFFRFF